MRDRPWFQFGLSSLLWFVTGFAVLCSAIATCPEKYRERLFAVFVSLVSLVLGVAATFFVLVVALDVFSWVKTRDPNAGTLGRKIKTLFRSRCFWMAFSFTLLIAICLNYIP
jgi:hypothetical protein